MSSTSQPASASATSAFESLIASSAKHQLAAAAGADRPKDGSTSVAASTSTPKELDTAGRVSEQLVKQIEVNHSPRNLYFVVCIFHSFICGLLFHCAAAVINWVPTGQGRLQEVRGNLSGQGKIFFWKSHGKLVPPDVTFSG